LRKYWYCSFEGSCTSELLVLEAKKSIENKYVFYVIQNESFLHFADRFSYGTKMPRVSFNDLAKYKCRVPKEKKEQEKIAKILSTLDKAIESTNRLIEKEKNIKTAIMQELLTNGIDKNGHIRSPQTHTYKESELGLIPDEWEVDKLNEVTKLMTDFVANGSFESLANNVTVFENPDFAYYVRLVDIRKGLGHEKQTYVDEQSFNFLKKSSLIGKEILIANIGANVGETFLMPIINKPATIAPNMIVVKVNTKIISEFLFYFLTYHKGISELQNVTEGSGQPKINKTKLKTINVLIPAILEQEKIIKILTTQDKKIQTEETTLSKLKELKKGLMNDLLSGKVRVKV
jgi:type I restriction enzyme S subunit